ncbi:hypothetical protein [Psychrobacillus sp. L4]|uniref:hypothetical protein n=1 Tax=Psychrobacillus sp. L4 TaxID=3236892 RepID=UPI0036F44D50
MLKHKSFKKDFSLSNDFSRRHSCQNPPALAGGRLIDCATKRKKEVEKIQAIQIEKEQSFASQFVVLA